MAFATEIPHKRDCTSTAELRYYLHAEKQIPMMQCKACKRFARDVDDHAHERQLQEARRDSNRRPGDPEPLYRPVPPPAPKPVAQGPAPRVRPDLEAAALPMLSDSRIDSAGYRRRHGVSLWRNVDGVLTRVEN